MNKSTETFEHFTTKDGLPNNVVYAVLTDSLGRLWLSTNRGISCFIPAKKFFHNFTVADGLQDFEFNTGAYYKHPDGRLFFGGVNGINIIKPNTFTFDTSFAPVFFTDLSINNQQVSINDSTGILNTPIETTNTVHLKYIQNFIKVSFAATDFSKLGINNYRYKMDGVDEEWVFANTRNEVSYPNLQPGTYTLHVSNSNENGDWNPKEAVITFIVSPPWWASNWAYGAYLFIIVSGAYLLYQQQIKRIRLRNELAFKEKEASKLAELDALKNSFFTNITHELRTPLTLIVEPARMMLADKQQPNSPFLHTIYNNSLRLLRLVNTLLDISKLEAGKMMLHFAEGDIVPLIKAVFDSFVVLAQQKQLQLQFNAFPNAIIAMVDKPMIEKIAHNLLSNAIKFTPNGGSITMSIATNGNDSWTLEVIDTGIGIEEKNLSAIFSRFYQVDNSSTRRGEGTGIGLALVKELVDQVKGTIEVKSKVGEGTRFTIQFATYPAIATNNINTIDFTNHTNSHDSTYSVESTADSSIWATPEVPTAATIAHNDNHENEQLSDDATSVLVVDDNAEMRSFIATILHQQGYLVYEAANGQVGIDKALDVMPTIIISDLMMPQKDGYELVSELKSNIITSHIPIVLLTAKQSLDAKLQGYQSGADAYLSKPFHAEELLIRMRQLQDANKRLQAKFGNQPIAQSPLATSVDYSDNLGTSVENAENATEDIVIATERLSQLDTELLAEIRQFIIQRIENDKIDIDELALQHNMSRRHFHRKLNALTGLSPIQFIRNTRLDHAYHLLTTSPNIRVNEAMYQVGISDKKHFNAHFKERFGETPSVVAQKAGANNADIDG